MANFRFNTAGIERRALAIMRRRVEAACIVVENHAKVLVSVEGTGVRTSSRRGRRKGTLIYNKYPSAPGEPPHVQTGRLRASITHDIAADGLSGRVGTNVKYGLYLEKGAPSINLQARPWLLRALMEKRTTVERILTAPLGSLTNPTNIGP